MGPFTTVDPSRAKLRHRRHVGGFAAFGRFIVRYRWVVVAIWLIVPTVLGLTLPSLASQVNNDTTAFLPANSPSLRAASLARPIIGSTTAATVTVVATSTAPLSTREAALVIATLRAHVRRVATVEKVDPGVLSGDRLAVQMLAVSDTSQFDQVATNKLVVGISSAIRRARLPSGVTANVAGQVATNVASQSSSQRSAGSTTIFSLLFIIVLLLVIFRSPVAPLVTLIPAIFALRLADPVIGALGQAGLKISFVAQLLLIVIILGAGTDYGLFLVFRVREELEHGRDRFDAVAASLARVGESITASAGTVIAALLTLLLATFGMYHDLAVPLALGVSAILLAGLTLLPALLAILGNAVFWPVRPTARAHRDALWGRVAARLVQRPARTLTVGVLALVALSIGGLFLASAGFDQGASAPSESSAAHGNAAIAAHFPEQSSNPTNLILRFPSPIWASASKLNVLGGDLATSGQFTTLAGPLDPMGVVLGANDFTALHAAVGSPQEAVERHLVVPPAGISAEAFAAYRSDVRYVSSDGRTVQFEAGLAAGSPSSTAALNAIPAIRAALAQSGAQVGATRTGVAGQAAALYDVSSTSSSDLKGIVPVAALAIGLVLALVLRSLTAPAYLVVSVVLSYTASLGLAVIIFQFFVGEPGITFLLPFLLFIFLLALGEDYNILVMTRIREENTHMPLREAIVNAVGATGPTITSAGLVLAGTFGVLAVAGGSNGGGVQITVIGVGLASGILLDTFVVRTLLVPSIVALLGRWNWWPSRLYREPELHHD